MKKPVSAATRAMLAEMQQDAAPPQDKVDALRSEIAKLRDKELEIQGLEQRASELKQDVRHIKEKTLVDLFDEAGVNSLGIDASGNLPPYDVRLDDYYHANIPDEQQSAAYSYLRESGNDDLIKTVYTVAFGLREAKNAAKFEKLLDKSGVQFSMKQGVPWNTLTAWFRSEHKKKPLPLKVMALLGASVGRVAKVVKQKEKK